MKNKITQFNELNLKDKIFTIRGYQVMLDRDLAELYEVDVKRLNEQVKRNIERFPLRYSFVLNNQELRNLKSQIATSSWGGRRKLPRVFTEHGVSMLSSVLRSKKAIKVSLQIIDAFISMRKFLNTNVHIFQRLDRVELKQIETDKKFDQVFKALESNDNLPKQGIFYEGQIFNAHMFVSDLFSRVKKSVVIIDNYIDKSILNYLSQLPKNVNVKIITRSISDSLKFDIEKFEKQHFSIEVKIYKKAHDRFIIIDEKEVYHIGASIKDLGKKLFAFARMDNSALSLINKIERS